MSKFDLFDFLDFSEFSEFENFSDNSFYFFAKRFPIGLAVKRY